MTSLASRRPGRLAFAAGVAAAAAVVAGIAIIAPGPFANSDSANQASEWVPAGTEFPSTDLGPATLTWGGPTVEDLTRQIGIAGHPNQILSRSVAYLGGERAEEHYCTWENGGGGCRPANLPVSWSSASRRRPTMGTPVGRNSFEIHVELMQTYIAPRQADLTDADQTRLGEMASSSMFSCLTDAGGVVGTGGIATFADDVDQIAVWNDCVPVAEGIAAARLAEIDPVMSRPTAEPTSEPGQSGATPATTLALD